MTYRPASTLRVLQLLAWTSLHRLGRAAAMQRARRAAQGAGAGTPAAPRRATARKRGDGLAWLMLLLLPLFLFQATVVTGQAVHNLQRAADTTPPATGDADAIRAAAVERLQHHRYDGGLLAEPVAWQNPAARPVFLGCSAVLLLLLAAMFVVIGIGGANATLAGGSWTQAWLMTFPVATRSLVIARVLEYGLVAFLPWMTYWPLTWQLLRALDVKGAPLLAAVATLATTFLAGAARLWCETRLRLACSLQQLRSVQGLCSLVGMLLMAGVFSVVMGPSVVDWFVDCGRAVPGWLALLPGAWPLAIGDHGVLALGIGLGVSVLAVAGAVHSTCALLRGGVMRSGGVDAGERGRQGIWRRGRRLTIAGKDLALLLRDRNFLVQTVMVPVFVIGMQLVVNPGLGRATGNGIAPLAYGIGLYALIGGCFQVLSGEGRALWMLYALPVQLQEVLRRKTRIWASLAVGYGLVAMLTFGMRAGDVDVLALVRDGASVALGVWCAAHIAAGISVIGCNAAADHVPRQAKARHVYLYFFFAGSFMVGLSTSDWSVRITATMVFATLAYAVWQRACDRLQWLLDPVVEPRDHIGVYDAGAAIVVFYLGQALLLVILLGGLGAAGVLPTTPMLLAFVIGGAVSVLVFVPILRNRDVDLRGELGLRSPGRAPARNAMLAGVGLGAGAALLALGYLALVRRQNWFELPAPPPGGDVALLLLAVVGAPIVEELLFRGLLFGGLRRSVRPMLAVAWSAGLFATMHPVVSWPPVFVIGVLTAMLYQRSRFLPATMLLHATYNLIVITCQ